MFEVVFKVFEETVQLHLLFSYQLIWFDSLMKGEKFSLEAT